jgi:serine protease Do
MRIVGACFLVSLALIPAIPAAEPTEPELLAAVEKQLKAANEKAGPCVACVVVSKSDRYPKMSVQDQPGKLGRFDKEAFLKAFPDQKRLAVSLDLEDPHNITDHGFACGVVIDPAGLILTPYHVVEGAAKVYVHLPGQGGSYADIHAADSRYDLAVLKLINPVAGLTAIKFGEVRLREQYGKPATIAKGKLTILLANNYLPDSPVNKPVAALGSVTGFYKPSPSRNEPISDSYYFYGPLIAHDAKLNTGIDGAALLNLNGELIGLTTSTPTLTGERGPSYAFPADEYFRNVVEVLRKGEEVEYGYLGVRGPLEEQRGMKFERVMPRGPAAKAGMDERHLLMQVNGLPTTTYTELLLRIGLALAGTKVKLTILDRGQEREVTVTLGKFAHKQPFIASVRPEPVFGLRVEYSSILAQREALDARLLGNGVSAGVCIREIIPDSPAAAAFKKLPGNTEKWLITHVNGMAVDSPAEFYKAAKGQKSIKLTVQDPTEVTPRDKEVTLP